MGIHEICQEICLAENLILAHEIGEGSFKKVYLAKKTDNTPIALKIIKDATPNLRTQREVEAIFRCDHQNIGKLFKFDSLTVNGITYQYFFEEFFDGGSLTELLRSRKPANTEVHIFGSKMIEVLEYLSAENLVHRDIKPDNLMFRSGSLEPVLVDFGIVRDLVATSLTHTWGSRGPGTPYYSSPEQLNNQKSMINWRSDQFSLGIVLCICLLGYHPFQLDSENHYAPSIVDRVALNGKRNPRVLDELARMGFVEIERMTRVFPAERYRFPSELLNQWQNQEILK